MDRYYHEELDLIRTHVHEMGHLAVQSVAKAVKALIDCDLPLAEDVISGDIAIDNFEIQIDGEANRYLTLRSPVAADLRVLTVAIKTSHNIERIGDEAKKVAKKARHLIQTGGLSMGYFQIPEMGQRAEKMVQEALRCFMEQDVAAARALIEADKHVDALDKANIKALISQVKEDPDSIDRFLDLIFVSKSLERIADHATNLAEEIIYMITAEDPRQIKAEG